MSKQESTGGSAVIALMHLSLSPLGFFTFLGPLDHRVTLTASALYILIPATFWLLSTSQFSIQHARNALLFALVFVLVLPIGQILLIMLLSNEEDGFWLVWHAGNQSEHSYLTLMNGYHNYLLEEHGDAPFVFIVLPAFIITLAAILLPLFGTYRASRGRPSDYFGMF